MDNEEIESKIREILHSRHGTILFPQKHHLPEWFGEGWFVSFEISKRPDEKMPVIRAAFFRNENGRPMLAREFVVRDADGNYPAWRSIAEIIRGRER
jgi:hypothetical protein